MTLPEKQLSKNFNLLEFHCKDGTPVPAPHMANLMLLVKNLQILRDYLGLPVHVISGYRTVSHNKAVGGARQSQHLVAKAADITVKGYTPAQLHKVIEMLITTKSMKQGGLGLYAGFVHYDVRGRRARWVG